MRNPKDMSVDAKILWLVAGISLVALLPILFVPTQYARLAAAAALAVAAGAALLLVKKRRIPSLYYRQVMGLLVVSAVVYHMLCYLSVYAFGYYRNYPALSLATFFQFILPAAVIIVSGEILRSVLLSHKGFFISLVAFLLCMVADLLLGKGISQIGNFYNFLTIVGTTLLPSITSNLFYHYVARRYGALPNIAYRLILSLTTSFLPVIPAVPDALNAFLLLLLPLALWVFMDALYGKKKKQKRSRRAILALAGTVLSLIGSTALIMLISCEFWYGMIIVSTPSMTGAINVGDAIVYETYDDQIIREGDIIVFTVNGGDARIIHRVVKIENINGQNRYYTKGDANLDWDNGYLTSADIQGVVTLILPMVGQPSLWLREAFGL